MKDVRAERIVALLNEMRSSGVPFNAWVHGPTRVDAGGDKYRDCAALALADNGEGWEAVSESGNGLYDLDNFPRAEVCLSLCGVFLSLLVSGVALRATYAWVGGGR